MSKTKAGIINVTGYAGEELARLLYRHPEVKITSVTGRSAAGQKLGTVFPHLADLRLTIEAELGDVDIAFSAMPHKESAKEVIPLLKRGIKGSYVNVEPFHLFRYLDEEVFRFNNRKVNDAERFQRLLGEVVGHRLTYQKLIGSGATSTTSA